MGLRHLGECPGSRTFVAAINRGDVDGASACFTHKGLLIAADWDAVRGHEEIAALVARWVEGGIEIVATQSDVLETCRSFELRSEGWRIRRGRRAHESTATLLLNDLEDSWKLTIVSLGI